MLLGGKALQHWRQFKSQAMSLPILGVLDESEESSEEEEGKERGTESGKVPAGITQETYKLSMLCGKDIEALPKELPLKTKEIGNLACGGKATRD
eukprot:10806165-Ditylum_brightwellii.AAC.1